MVITALPKGSVVAERACRFLLLSDMKLAALLPPNRGGLLDYS